MSWIDHKHLETIGVLHWMKVLTDYIPELTIYRSFISLLLRTRGAKHRVPLWKTKVHPLAMSGKNEVVMVKLKDTLLDFFAQIGQMHEDYLPHLLFSPFKNISNFIKMPSRASRSLNLC